MFSFLVMLNTTHPPVSGQAMPCLSPLQMFSVRTLLVSCRGCSGLLPVLSQPCPPQHTQGLSHTGLAQTLHPIFCWLPLPTAVARLSLYSPLRILPALQAGKLELSPLTLQILPGALHPTSPAPCW